MTVYRIGSVDFDPDACEIRVEGEVQHLQPLVSKVLVCLVTHQGRVVSRDQLVAEAWDGRRTSDESITRCISLLRRQLEDQGGRQVIETIPKVGYRLCEPVAENGADNLLDASVNATPRVDVPPKTAVNLVVTIAVLILLLSGLVIAADFFALAG